MQDDNRFLLGRLKLIKKEQRAEDVKDCVYKNDTFYLATFTEVNMLTRFKKLKSGKQNEEI